MFKQNKFIAVLITILILACFMSGCASGGSGKRTTQLSDPIEATVKPKKTEKPTLKPTLKPTASVQPAPSAKASGQLKPASKATAKAAEKHTASKPVSENANTEAPIPELDEYQTEPIPEPEEPQDVEITNKENVCTLSIRCDTVLDSFGLLKESKRKIIPSDGVLLSEREVEFYEGESVFNVLLRETRKNKIHMEFVNTPIYNSAYIEGIGNLYEFDCGELSGWMYKVNDRFPNYGCSRYTLQPGDKIEWIYTCDLGRDVGGDGSAQRDD